MAQIFDYKILRATSQGELEVLVRDQIVSGKWEPIGGLMMTHRQEGTNGDGVTSYYVFFQAMIKTTP